jgi:hypothetical protein
MQGPEEKQLSIGRLPITSPYIKDLPRTCLVEVPARRLVKSKKFSNKW